MREEPIASALSSDSSAVAKLRRRCLKRSNSLLVRRNEDEAKFMKLLLPRAVDNDGAELVAFFHRAVSLRRFR